MRFTVYILIALSLITILITGFWGHVTQVVFPNTTWGLYDKDFFENLLVEMHGGIIDLLVVGVILYWFERKKTEKDTIKKAELELANLNYYCGTDSSYRFYGALKYLLSLGVDKVSIPEGNLSKLKIECLTLKHSNLIALNFSGSTLKKVDFSECNLEASQFIDTIIKDANFVSVNLKRSKFINAELKGIDFRGCDIKGVNFDRSRLQSSNFSGLDCSRVSFKGANLRSANFKGAINLSKEMILEASNYDHIKLPDGVEI
ncbi:pentapeptide repeat-containing protein [Colwellia sp. Arc7-635]|uniref:pentapeptide repeat-containing protein n=1 Tax=Colwellia sp. Arc7-635 TaxID=2497879 RepID=UPI000F857B9C|nr:pentapeptide repeat-containing protein [Colwellia sp. Arc7-635]AZQ85034.1 pentapeptide repeat-containing protein [Colwellia sp. Arc7-635]